MTALICVILSALSLLIGILSYQRYRQQLIQTEQGQLLTVARIIGTSLQEYIEQEIQKIDLCFDVYTEGEDVTPFTLRRSCERLLASSPLYRGCLCLYQDETLFTLGESGEMALALAPLANGQAQILGKYQADTGWYELLVGKVLNTRSQAYTLVWNLDLNCVYQEIVHPVKIGQGGYSVVKDDALAIIMHHVQSQIGMDALYDREERYPGLDLTSLKAWLQMQREQEEGVGILNSYVWDDPSLTPVQRIVAYTTITIQSEHWIVNSTLPISELSAPLRRMILLMAGLTLLYLTLMILLVSTMTRMMVQAVSWRREIEYLQQINRGLELISKQQSEIQHYQRVQSLGMMSSHIAHEFNNYLTPVMVYGEILEGDPSIPQDGQSMIREMMKSVDQAARLSRDLLDFSRMDAGGILQSLNLSEEVAEAVSIIRQLVPKAIHFEVEADTQPAWLIGRQGMVQHILMNLCKNAFQAMEGTAEKQLSIRYRLYDGKATLQVIDTGCGIRAEDLSQIFDPFYTTKGSGQGTGLGLSTVRSLTEQAGGTITVQSCPGKGTTFSMVYTVMPDQQALRRRKEGSQIHHSLCLLATASVPPQWKDWLSTVPGTLEYSNQETAVIARLREPDAPYDMLILQENYPSLSGPEIAQIIRPGNQQMRIVLLARQMDEKLQWYLDSGLIDEVRLPT